jgi:hypothetical protein
VLSGLAGGHAATLGQPPSSGFAAQHPAHAIAFPAIAADADAEKAGSADASSMARTMARNGLRPWSISPWMMIACGRFLAAIVV